MNHKRRGELYCEEKKYTIPHILLYWYALLCSLLYFRGLCLQELMTGYWIPIQEEILLILTAFIIFQKPPITFIQFISAYSGGFTNAASMIFMTLVVGGTFGIINELGIIPAALAIILKKFDKEPGNGDPVPHSCFGLFESFMGAPELCIIFLPMILPLVLDLGFDTMTALAIVICGTALAIVRVWEIRLLLLSARRSASFLFILSMWYRAICFFLFYGIYCMVYFKICERKYAKIL